MLKVPIDAKRSRKLSSSFLNVHGKKRYLTVLFVSVCSVRCCKLQILVFSPRFINCRENNSVRNLLSNRSVRGIYSLSRRLANNTRFLSLPYTFVSLFRLLPFLFASTSLFGRESLGPPNASLYVFTFNLWLPATTCESV